MRSENGARRSKRKRPTKQAGKIGCATNAVRPRKTVGLGLASLKIYGFARGAGTSGMMALRMALALAALALPALEALAALKLVTRARTGAGSAGGAGTFGADGETLARTDAEAP